MVDIQKHIDTLIEVEFDTPEMFTIIRETLERIGIPNFKKKEVYQTCHIFHKRDSDGNSHYYLVHFKQLFPFDGREAKMNEEDFQRLNAIALLLKEWELLDIVKPSEEELEKNAMDLDDIFVLKHFQRKDKSDNGKWTVVPKYNIGRRK